MNPPSAHRREQRQPTRGQGGANLRIVSLAMMLALVIAAMASLREPDTVARLGRVFGLKSAPAPRGANAEPAREAGHRTDLANAEPVVRLGPVWDEVQDNAPFLAAEDDPWYSLISAVSDLSPDQLRQRSLGETTPMRSYWRSIRELIPDRFATSPISTSPRPSGRHARCVPAWLARPRHRTQRRDSR